MNEMKLNWDDLRLFLEVARARGLGGAVANTGKSAPTLGRRMLALEEVTGIELFHRLKRGYELTESGTRFLQKISQLEQEILPLEQGADADGQRLVKVSAGSWMTLALCQRIDAFAQGSSSVKLRFISAEHVLDISRREAVIGIRNLRPVLQDLVCRKTGRVQFALYSVGSAIKATIRVSADTASARWLAAQPHGPNDIEVSAPRNALDLAAAGYGRALLPTFIGDSQPGLQRVSPSIRELAHDQWLVTHQVERFKPEVRETIDTIYRITSELLRNASTGRVPGK